MARLPRLAIPGQAHYVLQRGHNGSPIATDATDRSAYLSMLRDAARASGVQVHAYSVGPTEARMLCTPGTPDGLSKMIQGLGRRYVAAFNRRHGRTGTLWVGRFRAVVIDPSHVLDALCHVERAGGTTGPGAEPAGPDDEASSAAHHLGRRRDALVNEHPAYWALGNTPFDREAAYRQRFAEGLDPDLQARLTQAVASGWPSLSEETHAAFQRETARRLQPKARGRPCKVHGD